MHRRKSSSIQSSWSLGLLQCPSTTPHQPSKLGPWVYYNAYQLSAGIKAVEGCMCKYLQFRVAPQFPKNFC